MTTQYKSMTPEALASRANEVIDYGSVHSILGKGDDHRDVQVFIEHFDMRWTDDGDLATDESYAEIIGVVIGGYDPHFKPDVLDRNGARDLFGDDFVLGVEETATEKLMEWK